MLPSSLLRLTSLRFTPSARTCASYSTLKPMAPTGGAVRVAVAYRPETAEVARRLLEQNAQLNTKDTQFQLLDIRDTPDCQAHFNKDAYFSSLPEHCQLGSTVLIAEQMQSTQVFLQNNISIIPDNSVCIAYRQSGGKGRGGNAWESPAGCLMFSVYKQVSISGQHLPFIQYVATLAIVQAVRELAQQRLKGRPLNIRIKWPNDLYINDMKIGGVLCHSTYQQQNFHVVIGVGLNLDNSYPTTCINDLVKQRQSESEPSSPITREELLACLLNKLEAMVGILTKHGFEPLQDAYLQAWLHSNQQVTLIEDGNQEVNLTITGLTKYGYLRASSSEGEFALHPDGNSLDFFKGLIRRKLE